ncbi:chorismate mutase, partial [Bacillus sp. AFS053548]|uniref:chorismate mutase n=1 Tax=Bacillus sp. AFS053548 TaxID=2033505 RepID=UPI000C036C72
MSSNNELINLRDKVDEINLKIVELLNERGKVVQEIGQQKIKHGIKRFDPVR